MHCQQFDQWLDDYLDGDLLPPQQQQFKEHCQQCARCQTVLRQSLEILQTLRAMPVPAMPEDYAQRQFQRLWSEKRYEQPVRRRRYFYYPALAASLLLGVLLGGGLMNWFASGPSPLSIQPLTVALYETREVRFVVNARRDLASARVTIRIPDHLELAGYPGRQELTWTTSLKAGANLLSLPLRAANPGSGEVVMVIDSKAGTLAEKSLVVESADKRTTGSVSTIEVTG